MLGRRIRCLIKLISDCATRHTFNSNYAYPEMYYQHSLAQKLARANQNDVQEALDTFISSRCKV